MGTSYTEFQYFFPPRSKSYIPYSPSPVLEMWKNFPDAIAQYKLNGSNDMLTVYPDRSIKHWSRHRIDPYTRKYSPKGIPKELDYTLPEELAEKVLAFTPKGVFTIYNVELLHNKTKMVKDTIYFFDVLVWAGEHLLGATYLERYNILAGLLGNAHIPLEAPTISKGLFIPENIPPVEWDKAWERAKMSPFCEGLVLKRSGATSSLSLGARPDNNGDFMCKCVRKNMLF